MNNAKKAQLLIVESALIMDGFIFKMDKKLDVLTNVNLVT